MRFCIIICKFNQAWLFSGTTKLPELGCSKLQRCEGKQVIVMWNSQYLPDVLAAHLVSLETSLDFSWQISCLFIHFGKMSSSCWCYFCTMFCPLDDEHQRSVPLIIAFSQKHLQLRHCAPWNSDGEFDLKH